MYDLQEATSPRHSMRGPLPKGSRALVRLTIEKSQYPVPGQEMLSRSSRGLAQLPVRLEIASGRYAGYHWFERITAPEKFQPIELDERQKMACKVGSSILRGIIESAYGIDPSDQSEEAQRLRRIDSWNVFSGLIFPAKLDINPHPLVREDKIYWRNALKYILPVTDTDYKFIMEGGEYISKGPVVWIDPATGEEGTVE